ncbi:MAG: tRNA pseudouridine(55) synthase TruB [Acidimicrobiia bacterium]|nr:tRNA pseudouridine(55) synthase TruB [Acidimicrobiia bacterium]
MTGPADRRDGFAVIDKEPGCTSHDVVARARRLLGIRKVGHAGTLDPDATGVLILGVGRATRLLRYVTALGKTYEATVVFGTTTDTCDAAGSVVGTWDMSDLTESRARAAAAAFVGEIQQIARMVSAVKVGGRRVHELAREGLTVPRDPRTVRVESLELTGFSAGDRPRATVTLTCSSGTYVRTLAADWGAALGGGAHLATLRRTAVGSFTQSEARPLERLELLAPATGVRDYDSLTVPEAGASAVAQGRRLPATGLVGEGPWAVLDESGSLLAMCERRGDALQPVVVLAVENRPRRPGAAGGGAGPPDR